MIIGPTWVALITTELNGPPLLSTWQHPISLTFLVLTWPQAIEIISLIPFSSSSHCVNILVFFDSNLWLGDLGGLLIRTFAAVDVDGVLVRYWCGVNAMLMSINCQVDVIFCWCEVPNLYTLNVFQTFYFISIHHLSALLELVWFVTQCYKTNRCVIAL